MSLRILTTLLVTLACSPSYAQTTSVEDTRPGKAAADVPDTAKLTLGPLGCLKNPNIKGCTSFRIESIVYKDLWQTQRFVLDRELLFQEGDTASLRQIEESITRLRNLGIFRTVTYALTTKPVPSTQGEVLVARGTRPARVLEITVDERWTLLPGFSFVQGATLFRLNASIYDINLLGRYLEVGFQYGRLGLAETFFEPDGAANTFVLWYRDRRLFDSFWSFSADLWSYTRLRTIYEPGGAVEGGHVLNRGLLALRFQREFDREFRLGFNLELMQDSFGMDLLPETTQQAQRQNFEPLEPGRAVIARAYARFGRVNRDDFYYDGWQLLQSIGHSSSLWGATYNFTSMETVLSGYKRIPWRGNLAGRVRYGLTDSRDIQYQYYLGGLDRVRGYPDSRFRGRQYWVANAEYRVAPLATRWVVLQPVTFLDLGRTSDDFGGLLGVDAGSAGVGIRVISPKIYGFVARFDYAFPFLANQPPGLTFGAQQFF